jgi:cephalosporin-C deacetylase-like acetyl esterase
MNSIELHHLIHFLRCVGAAVNAAAKNTANKIIDSAMPRGGRSNAILDGFAEELMSVRSLTITIGLAVFAFLLPNRNAAGQEKEILTVLHSGPQSYEKWIDWTGGEWMLVKHLNAITRDHLERRAAEVASLESETDWRKRQAKVREILDSIVGPWPDRTPLRPRVTGVLDQDGYRVEKIVFESMPGFHVTGALFLPKGIDQPRPAVLKVIGHSAQAFRRDVYQNVILNLVHQGFVVFAIDPIGQGERLQYYDAETGRSLVGSSTQEHSHAGVQCFLLGKSIARYFTWDGIRAIDYLHSRPEVDPSRIGVTGLSGGGTQSSYIGAMDDRVVAAAPMGFITSISRLLGSIGPQDAEQVLYHGPRLGIDHADLLEVRAPKPTLHVTTTRDFFSIQGARETAQEVARAFAAFGKRDHYRQVEDDGRHGFTRKNNEATYAFFQNALNRSGESTERAYPFLSEQQLTVTKSGQVATEFDGETVFSINRKEATPMLQRLAKSRKQLATHLPEVRQQARQLSGYVRPEKSPGAVFRGRYQRDGYRVEKWGLSGEGDTILPVLLFTPEETEQAPAVIYADGRGKQTDAEPGGRIESLVRQGFVVAAVDLLGFGETEYGITRGHGRVQPFYNALMSGRSVTGINAGDIVRVLRWLQTFANIDPQSIGVVGIGDAGPAALHATAFESDLRWLVLERALVDYESLVTHKLYQVNANSLVAGALTAYDLPDLVASVAPRRVVIRQPQNHASEPASRQELDRNLGFAEPHNGVNLRIETKVQSQSLGDAIEWCRAAK